MKSVIENLGKVAPTFEGAFDNTKAYDRLSCVFDSKTGNSYISRRPVPVGIDIFNDKYWQPLSIGTNRIPLTENFGTDSFRSMTQKFLTELWNKQYEFNDTVKDAVVLSKQALDAIELLSKDQQEALKLAGAIVDCTKRLTILETNLNGYAFAEMTEDDYEVAKDNSALEDNKIYFVFEKQTDTEPDDDFE
jgi:hypothetical protein